ncbi:MAG: 1-deoxy-D-xylulose-5-phosphate synthase N-terminal domain-containing protein, partial [Flavobacteriaceae bacterium]
MKNLNEQDLPKAISTYDIEALAQLVVLVRERIIETIAKKGGHLGASLGTVELSVALHHVFDAEIDQLVWDVGHQAYGHKLLTGRAQDFDSIRDFEGLSGFLSRTESKYDSFGAGHSSTSISAAMGMALSQKLKSNGAQAIAIIGDASIVSGMAFEALNHLGESKADVLVILNDNAMGIDPSVGALKDHFSKGSNSIQSFFESFKIQYSGPIDGH